jgi:diacylglycerol O-acyltransferase / wax synthase
MILMETVATPMHIGALLVFDRGDGKAGLAERMRTHLAERLPGTPLLTRLHQAPDGYDSDVWVDVASCDLDHHVTPMAQMSSMAELYAFAASQAMERLDLDRPPFRCFVIDEIGDGRSAMLLKVHHALADGVGFQTMVRLLSDEAPACAPRTSDASLPPDDAWLAMAEQRFADGAVDRSAHRARADSALAILKGGTLPARVRTPVLRMSGGTSTERAFATVSLPLARIRSVAVAFVGTINDIFLAIASTAVRRMLIELDDLPETPIVTNSARSYRRPEHGSFGNRIVALHPHLATDIADPVRRLRAIQTSMAAEKLRTPYDEMMLDAPERPHGARDRRARFAERPPGAAVLPGNVSISNVPGPDTTLTFAGHRLLANHPTPIIGGGRFLNVTSRRLHDHLDLGIMVDPTRIPDVGSVAALLVEALDEYEHLASG